ncbi:MAG: EamA family transporter [Acidobacteriaceae bacterium]|nr:EamA family transporter [Acidobacteriaceae bacterium]MBV9780703.1 EamA family transporter [Acidobacteriaceae bacterium]
MTYPVRTIAAFAAIYLLWGSTYLAIRIAVETVPPLFAAGVRFMLAGLLVYAWRRWRGDPAPSRDEWRNLWLVGALLFLGGYSGLFWAEKSVPSGIASVLIAMVPVWIVILETVILRVQRLTFLTALAVILGLVGVAAIARGRNHGQSASLIACAAILGSGISWSVGTVISKRIRLPESKAISAGAQMICGGALLLVCALLTGEFNPLPQIPIRATFAIIYLTVAGSLVAFTAYFWLLHRMSSVKVTSYAYVNPVVALAIGYWLGGEEIHANTFLGSALVLVSVVVILTKVSDKR